MKYATYPAYKPSPMPWLDQMPEGWGSASLRWMSRRYAGGTPDKGNEAYWEDGDIPWLNSGAVNDGYITQPSELITREGFAHSSAKWIPKGALVMALAGQGKTKGMVAQLGIATTCNQSMAAIIPDRRLHPRYLYWWLTANYQNIRNLAGGEARDGLNLDLLGSIPCPAPSPREQEDIAAFLDVKSAQIDELVVKKRQLIDKLKEGRSALISRTVTRGLPAEVAEAKGFQPNPETRDSGVEWLGDIPTHWRPMRAKHLCTAIVDCKNRTPEYFDDGEYLVARTTDVRDGAISFETMFRTDEENFREWTARGAPSSQDVLFTREAPAGEAALFDGSRPMCLGQRMMYFRANPRLLNPRFLVNWIYGFAAKGYVESLSGGSTVTHLRVGQVLDFPVATPPIAEQEAIADFLDEKTLELDSLTQQALQVTERLMEYRQALITSTVTGRIDVRGFA
jgi:type I restriction enzyme, S subunit